VTVGADSASSGLSVSGVSKLIKATPESFALGDGTKDSDEESYSFACLRRLMYDCLSGSFSRLCLRWRRRCEGWTTMTGTGECWRQYLFYQLISREDNFDMEPGRRPPMAPSRPRVPTINESGEYISI
jgi:hypothetical protein